MLIERKYMIITIFLLIVAFSYQTLARTPSYETEEDCRSCHGITVDRHHMLAAYDTYNCINCHPVNWSNENQSYYTEVTRNCLICHPGKNHTEVHHILASQGLFGCTDCHLIKWDEQNQTYYPEVIYECTVCHSTVLKLNDTISTSPTPGPTPLSTSPAEPSPASTPHPAQIPDPDAPSGLHAQIKCSICHETQSTTEEICYQCHNDSRNSYHGINISYQFSIRSDSFSGMGVNYYSKVNTRHDITDADQNNSSTRIECTNCHSAHLASRENTTIDPDSGDPFTATMVHPGTGEIIIDSIVFCLKCHDNTWAADVTGPSVIMNISKKYYDTTNKGDEHGAASGKNKLQLIGPYIGNNGIDVPPLPCTDCHDPHGGKGIYHLRTLNDQYNRPVTITSYNIDDHSVAHWCSHCHYNPMNQLEGTKGKCLRCHIHGKKS